MDQLGLVTRQNRSIRVFISSTFRDMIEDRNALMTHTWPELRRFCRERQVELVEVDLRWGIAEEQSTRKETLKLCLDEIRACRPFFIGLMGERYGWVPGDDAFSADLKEEQPWLKEMHGKSITELEILHGVLNDPEMAGRTFFFFRDPDYAKKGGPDFLSETPADEGKQKVLKDLIRETCLSKNIPLHETYPDPDSLAALVLKQLRDAIEIQFPIEEIPDPLEREARDHEAFAEIRRRTYIGRPDYFTALNRYIAETGTPLVLLGDSGSGKSALLANWVDRWRKAHPKDLIFQHYIGGTCDSAVHWKIITRLLATIKRWTEDPEELPKTHDDILRDFAVWLAKARIKAGRDNVKFIVILDALNQLEDKDHAHTLGWLPSEPFRDNLRLIVSTLPGATFDSIENRAFTELNIEPLTPDERGEMIHDYLLRFGKKLDSQRVERLSNAGAASNPLYLKILLDELRVTGTHDRLDERLEDYLSANDIPTLLQKVLARYQRDYEHDREGLVSDALGLIWAARRGITETELLKLLRPDNLSQLPLATWSPLRAVLEESLVDRGGILNFTHDFLRTAVEKAFVPDLDKKDDYRLFLADYFEAQAPDARNCDELPWLLWKTESFNRLRECLLNINCFLEICKQDFDELRTYWVGLNEENNNGESYLASFKAWAAGKEENEKPILIDAAHMLGSFLRNTAQYNEAEPLINLSLHYQEDTFGKEHLGKAAILNNLALLYQETSRLNKAEPLLRRCIEINEVLYGIDHPTVAKSLCNLGYFLQESRRLNEAEPYLQRALLIDEQNYGKEHPNVARDLNNLARLYQATDRKSEAELLMNKALKIFEDSFGKDHPNVAIVLNNLAVLYSETNRLVEAEQRLTRVISVFKESLGENHPKLAVCLVNLAIMITGADRFNEKESLIKRAIKIDELSFGKDHPKVALDLIQLCKLYFNAHQFNEAESLLRRVLTIDERFYGNNHPEVATDLGFLAELFMATNRLGEAEKHMKHAVIILFDFSRSNGHFHPDLQNAVNKYSRILGNLGWDNEKINLELRKIAPDFFK